MKIGNFAIEEILRAIGQDSSDNILYTVDQLQSASIEISADPTEITDKNGSVIRTIYRTKTGTFSSQSALLHPSLLNVSSGTDMEIATATNLIKMPKIVTVSAGGTLDISDAKEGTVHVIGVYNNGANGKTLAQGTEAVVDETFALVDGKITVPAAADEAPSMYVVKYDRDVDDGLKMMNRSDKFPTTQQLTLQCAYVDPCEDDLALCYVYFPSFMPDPNMTINLDAETQELDFNGILQTSFCGTERVLYVIYFPATDTVQTGTTLTCDVEAVDGSVSLFETPVSDLQDGLAVSANAITGTLKYLDAGPIADYWGAGNFMALQFSNIPAEATSVRVGMDPSQGSGLVEVIDDPDKNGVFKVTATTQKFVVVVSDGTTSERTEYDLSGLTLLSE